MRRKHLRPVRRQPTDEEARRGLASQLVGARIAFGIPPQEVLAHIGYTYKEAPRKEKRGLSREKWVLYRLAVLENELLEGRLSLFQRYARAIGMKFTVQAVIEPNVQQRANMRLVRAVAARKLRQRRSAKPAN